MSVYESQFDVTKTIKVKITVSDSERTPEHILSNDVNGTFDGNKRWSAVGKNHFIDFEFDQILSIYGLDIGWYQGNEFRYVFKIASNSVNHVLFNGLSSGNSTSYETYEFDRHVNTRNIRILCDGNLFDAWSRISAIKFRLEPVPDEIQTVEPLPYCPEGQRWHEILGKCVPNEITEPPHIVINELTQTVKQGDNVLLDASMTTDPVGANLFFEWLQIGGDLVNTSNKFQPTLTFRAPTIDTKLTFRLLVTNSGELKSYGDATVLVRADKPVANVSDVVSALHQRPVERVLPEHHQHEPAVHTPKAKKSKR